MTGHPVPRRRDHRDLQHRAGAGARGRGLDVDLVQGRARCRSPMRACRSATSTASSGQFANDFVYQARLAPAWVSSSWQGIPAVLQAATAIATGMATTVLDASGALRAVYTDRASTAPWTRPSSEFVAPFGMFTAAEFALVARRHMHMYGTKPDALATVAAVIRNNGHVNPEAIYHGRGPFTPQDILDSRMVADPFHLLDCADRVGRGVRHRAHPGRSRRRRAPTGRSTSSAANGDTVGTVVQEPAHVGARRQPARGPRERHRRAARRRRTRSARGAGADRRRRVRVLRPVLVRDHPPVRGLRLLRRGRRAATS